MCVSVISVWCDCTVSPEVLASVRAERQPPPPPQAQGESGYYQHLLIRLVLHFHYQQVWLHVVYYKLYLMICLL